MFSLVSRASPSLRTKPVTQQRYEICSVIKRWSSSETMGSAPSQLPVPGERGWAALTNNIKKFAAQPPLSSAEILHGQEMHELRQGFTRMEKMFSDVVK